MAQRVAIISNGVIRMSTLSSAATIYDETFVALTDYAANQTFALPNAGTYESKELKVFHDGSFLEPGIDYNYVGSGIRTQIELLRPLNTQEKLRFRTEGIASTIYDEVVVIPLGGYAPNTTVSLPNGKTYEDTDLEVYLDGSLLEAGIDYTYVGPPSSSRTQITIIPELFQNERLRLRIG